MSKLRMFADALGMLKECEETISDIDFATESGKPLNHMVTVNVFELKRICEYIVYEPGRDSLRKGM